MQNKFTQKAQNVLNYALQYAAEMGHTYIGSEHLLLGLCKEQNGVAAHYLKERGADTEKIKNAIIQMAGIGAPSALSAADMTPRTKSIIQTSLTEAQKSNREVIGTEHLLAALLGEQDCVAVKILESMDVSIPELKSDLSSYLGSSIGGEKN